MHIFIDGEWNSYGGELISLALVAEDGRSFYEVLGCDNPDPWIAENVMPKLGKPWVTLESLQALHRRQEPNREERGLHLNLSDPSKCNQGLRCQDAE